MTPREIIAEAWAITTRERKLRIWGYTGSLFETVWMLQFILSQAYFLYVYFVMGQSVGWLSILDFVRTHTLPWVVIALTVFYCLMYALQALIPTIVSGAVIGLAAKSHLKQDVQGGLVLGLYNFFPLLEIRGLFILAHVGMAITLWSTILRYTGDSYGMKAGLTALVIAFWLLSALFRFFAAFAEEGIVISKLGVFASIGASFKLIISHLGKVVFLVILLLVISIRVFLNAIIVLLIPAVAIGLAVLLAMFLPQFISYVIALCVSLVLILILSYFLGYLHVFQQTVWTLMYLELRKQKDFDVID